MNIFTYFKHFSPLLQGSFCPCSSSRRRLPRLVRAQLGVLAGASGWCETIQIAWNWTTVVASHIFCPQDNIRMTYSDLQHVCKSVAHKLVTNQEWLFRPLCRCGYPRDVLCKAEDAHIVVSRNGLPHKFLVIWTPASTPTQSVTEEIMNGNFLLKKQQNLPPMWHNSLQWRQRLHHEVLYLFIKLLLSDIFLFHYFMTYSSSRWHKTFQ